MYTAKCAPLLSVSERMHQLLGHGSDLSYRFEAPTQKHLQVESSFPVLHISNP